MTATMYYVLLLSYTVLGAIFAYTYSEEVIDTRKVNWKDYALVIIIGGPAAWILMLVALIHEKVIPWLARKLS